MQVSKYAESSSDSDRSGSSLSHRSNTWKQTGINHTAGSQPVVDDNRLPRRVGRASAGACLQNRSHA